MFDAPDAQPHETPELPPLRTWEVTRKDGRVKTVTAHNIDFLSGGGLFFMKMEPFDADHYAKRFEWGCSDFDTFAETTVFALPSSLVVN